MDQVPPVELEARERLLTRGVAEVIVRESLERKLRAGQPLRVKFGIDPTGSVLHLGHAVILHKLREFQELGHQVIFLLGDFTAQIGDPTGRSAARQSLTSDEIETNLKTYTAQAAKILNLSRVEVRRNSEWLAKLGLQDIAALTSQVTFSQVAHRQDFKDRIKNDVELTLQEFMYPVLQGYDSVALRADVEVGGTDQKFNLLMGRQLQKRYGQEPQDIVTCPLLEGLNGGEKMSKSLDNYVALTAPAAEMYAALMSLADNLIVRYFELAAFATSKAVELVKSALAVGTNPRDLKMKLAREVVTLYHGSAEAASAEADFVTKFQKKEAPDQLETIMAIAGTPLVKVLLDAGLVKSRTNWRRLVEAGAVYDLDHDTPITDPGLILQDEQRLKIGKHRFVKIAVAR